MVRWPLPLLRCFSAGLRALDSLPAFSTEHVLEHRPGWGELYDILGVEPANLAQLLQVQWAHTLQDETLLFSVDCKRSEQLEITCGSLWVCVHVCIRKRV